MRSASGDLGVAGCWPDVGRKDRGPCSGCQACGRQGCSGEDCWTVLLCCWQGATPTMLELRRPGEPITGGQALLPSVPHAAASWPDSRLLQPHGLNCAFRVDTVTLQQRYQQLQRLVHPDFFSQRSQLNRKDWLMMWAELLKDTILKKPRNS